jgi:hypothetical protein
LVLSSPESPPACWRHPGPGSSSSFAYDNGTLSRGNVTQENRWDSETSLWETVFDAYDTYLDSQGGNFSSLCANAGSIGSFGNLTLRRNERGYSTVFCYDANADRMIRRVEAALPPAGAFLVWFVVAIGWSTFWMWLYIISRGSSQGQFERRAATTLMIPLPWIGGWLMYWVLPSGRDS